jgi:hypothetical protein
MVEVFRLRKKKTLIDQTPKPVARGGKTFSFYLILVVVAIGVRGFIVIHHDWCKGK